jgi:hypothetical protein
VERVTEGVETVAFKSLFSEWSAPTDFNFNKFNKDAVKKEDEPVDIQKLLSMMTLEAAPVDDGSGETLIVTVRHPH